MQRLKIYMFTELKIIQTRHSCHCSLRAIQVLDRITLHRI